MTKTNAEMLSDRWHLGALLPWVCVGTLLGCAASHPEKSADVSPSPMTGPEGAPERAADVLSQPTQEWVDGLASDPAPSDDDATLLLVYLGGLQTIRESGQIPEEFI
jgi:hypothetical protein